MEISLISTFQILPIHTSCHCEISFVHSISIKVIFSNTKYHLSVQIISRKFYSIPTDIAERIKIYFMIWKFKQPRVYKIK